MPLLPSAAGESLCRSISTGLIVRLNALFQWQVGLDYGLIVNVTAFEFLPVHPITNVFPMAPETEVVFPLGGLNTNTSTDPGFAISAAVIAPANW
jgi:hypothetical protein